MILGFVQTPTYGIGGGVTGCAHDGVGAFSRTFTQDDLVNGIVNVHHTFGTTNVVVQVYDNLNQLVLPTEITINDGNDVDVSLVDGTPLEGTWRVTLMASEGGCNEIGSYARSFEQSDLVDETLKVYHNLKTDSILVQVYDQDNQLVLPSEIRVVDDDNVYIDLTDGTPLHGTWHVTILSTSGYKETPSDSSGAAGITDCESIIDCLQGYTGSLNFGGAGGTGSLSIQDEGVTISTGAQILNFVGPDVFSRDMGNGVVNVYIPTPEFPTVANITAQERFDGQSFSLVNLDNSVSGTYTAEHMTWEVFGTDGQPPEFFIFDISADRVATVSYPLDWVSEVPRSETVRYQATDPSGFMGFMDVTYTLKPSYPFLNLVDVSEYDPNIITIDLKARVSDINHDPSDMVWSCNQDDLLSFNVTIDNGVATLLPKLPGWTGSDYLRETIAFFVEDPKGLKGNDTLQVTLIATPPVMEDIPDQVIFDGQSFSTIDLNANVTDLGDADSALVWEFTKGDGSPLTLYRVVMDASRVATIEILDPTWLGTNPQVEIIKFKVTDPKGQYDYREVTFTTNPSPPILTNIPGQHVKDGDTFNTVSLNSHVSDINHTDAEQVWSFTKTDGSPLDKFVVTVNGSNVASVKPIDEDWRGLTPLSETIRFTATDPKFLTDYEDVSFVMDPSPPVTTSIPDQEIYDGDTFNTITLDNYVSDYNHSDGQLSWEATDLAGNPLVFFKVTIDFNRVASIEPVDADWRGASIQEDILFKVTDPKDLTDAEVVSFTMLASPPKVTTIPNQSRIQYSYPANPLQGTTVLYSTVSLDSYVSDHNHSDSELVWTALKTNGSALENFTVAINSRVATITPVDNTWSGSETIRFTAEDPKELTDYTDVVFSITPPPYVSDYNTQDGVTDARVPDKSTTSRYVSGPTSEGTPFGIGDWSEGTVHPVVRDADWSYTTPGYFLIESLDTDFVAEVLGPDESTVLAAQTITGLNGNTSVVGNVSLVLAAWAYDYNLYKAKVSVTVDIEAIIPNGGRFYVRLTHSNGTVGTFSKEQGSVFYDPDSVAAAVGTIEVRDLNANFKYLSGVRYYGAGSTLKPYLSGITDLNNLSYPGTQVQLAGDFNMSGFTLTGPQLTGWTPSWDSEASYVPTTSTMTVNSGVYTAEGAIQARLNDWDWSGWTSSVPFKVNVDTSSSSPSRIFEDFKSEDYRYLVDGSALWDSEKNMNSYDSGNGLQLCQGRLIYRSVDYTQYNPDIANQPNYSGYAGTGDYVRFMWHSNVSHSSGVLKFADYNFTETEFQAGVFLVDISLDGITWFSLNSSYFGGALISGAGCRVDIGANNLSVHNRVKFTLGSGGFSSASSNWGVFIRVRIPSSSSSKYLGQMELTDWV